MKILGFDIVDTGKNVFGGVHTAGKALASAFGYKGAADSLENYETKAGMLPDWAKSTKPGSPVAASNDLAVTSPDYVVVLRQPAGQKALKPFVFDDVIVAGVVGGARIDGNGYRLGDGFGSKFSFGIDSPKRLDVAQKNGSKTSYVDVKQVLFCGGGEAKVKIAGIERSTRMSNGKKIVGYSDLDIDTEGSFTVGDAYTVGADVLGAVAKATAGLRKPVTAPARAGFTIKTSPATGRAFTSLSIPRPGPNAKKHDSATSIKNAKDAGTRAISTGKKINDRLKTQGIHGLAAPARPATARGPVKLSATDALKVKKAADAAIKAGSEVIKLADKHQTVYTGAKAKLATGVKAAQVKYNPANDGKTNVHGAIEVLGAIGDAIDDDINYAIYGDGYTIGDPPPIADPLNPGYMTDGSIDPTYGSTPAYGSAPTYDAAPANVANTMPGPPDYGVGPAPSQASIAPVLNVDYVPDPGPGKDANFYSSTGDGIPLPLGYVPYDGSHPFGDKTVGSYTFFNQVLPTGEKPRDGAGSGYYLNSHGKWRAWVASAYHDGVAIDTRSKDLRADEKGSLPIMAANSRNNNWGPLIGKNTGWTKGLRYDMGGDQWFWYRDQAPGWATAADDAVRLNQAVLDYKAQITAAAADYAAAQAQDKLDAQNAAALAKQQAAEDAQMAHQQQVEMQQAQQQANLQMAAQPAAQAQLDQQYQAAQIQQQQQQAQLDQQYQQMQMQMQQQQAQQAAQANDLQLQYAQQHPEVFQSIFQPQGGGYDDQPGYGQQQPGYGAQQGYGDQGDDEGGGDVDYDNGVNWGTDDRDTFDRSGNVSADELEDDL